MAALPRLARSPTDPAFVQNPYPFYDRARMAGPLVWWQDYAMPAAVSHGAVNTILRDRRFGRAPLPEQAAPWPAHLADFAAVDAHSMLELEPPAHTRLRGQVVRAFTSRRIAGLAPEIAALAHELIESFPESEPFDLLPAFAERLPVIVIARFLGVPEAMADQLLDWSHAMVAMYQAGRTRQTEDRANAAARAFSAFLSDYVEERRARPGDDLISHLIAAEDEGEKLNRAELIATCILLLNAGHEATVHTIGNGVKLLLERGIGAGALAPDRIEATVEEILRLDPPLHLFTRIAYEPVEVAGHRFARGEEVALLLAAAGRDPAAFEAPAAFRPGRAGPAHLAFGAGLHFCVGAPLARLEMVTALPILFSRCAALTLAEPPRYRPIYHFHGLERLSVTC